MDVDKVTDPSNNREGGGFLGQHLANDLVMQGYRVVLFDIIENRSLLGNHVNFDNCKIISGDILDLSELIDAITKYEVKSIIHAAAILPPACDLRPHQSIKVNILGTCNVLESTRRNCKQSFAI
jgi:nucleoside-diphosphate-sugar epimerase